MKTRSLRAASTSTRATSSTTRLAKTGCKLLTLDKVFITKKVTAKDVKDFMKVSALVLENLAKQFKTLNPTKDPDPSIYYPNCSRKPNNF